MIIDSHCHAGKGDGLTGPWDTAAPLRQISRPRCSGGNNPHGPLLPRFIPIMRSLTVRLRASSQVIRIGSLVLPL